MSSPVVLISPAMAIGSQFYRPVVETFERRGWQARALPRRGFERDGIRASRSQDWSYADEIADTAEAVAKARADFPGSAVLLLGHSLGGHIAAGNQVFFEPADGLILVGTSLPWFGFYPRGGLPLVAMGLTIPLAAALRGFIPAPLFGAPGARTLMREWAHIARTGQPPFAVPRRITTPSLAIDLEHDTYAVARASRHFEQAFVEPEALTHWVYRRADAPQGGTTHHVHWVRTPGPVIDRIIEWWAQGQG